MIKKTRRAIRRHHRVRLFNRALRMWREWGIEDPLYARKTLNHMAVCSCHACGNQRRNPFTSSLERSTMAERKNVITFKEEMEEV